MNIVLIVQARMGSTRLPGKVLRSLVGKPMLARVIERIRGARTINNIVVATSEAAADDPIARLAQELGVDVFRGSESDVLDRYYSAAKHTQADVVVRVTGDCPMHEAKVVDAAVTHFLAASVDYMCNVATAPEGQDTEVFSMKALERAWKEATLPSEREHVTLYMRTHPDIFRLEEGEQSPAYPGLHLSVDTPEDFAFAEAVFKKLGDHFKAQEVVELLASSPDLSAINKGGTGYEGLEKSLKEDRTAVFVRGLRVGVVGCGSIGARHARNLQMLRVGEILVCDPNSSRAESLAREVGGVAYTQYETLLAQKLHAVIIATPSSLHTAQASLAATKGVAIFMEKPLATSMDGLDALLELVEHNKVITMMGQSYRWHEGVVALRQKLAAGELGAITHVTYRLGQYLPDWHPQEDYRKEYAAQKRLGGGAMFTSMSHTLDIIEWLFGPLETYSGKKERNGALDIDVDDTAKVQGITTQGVVVDAVNDFLAKPAVHSIEVKGEKGTVVLDLAVHTLGGVPYVFDANRRYVEEMRYFLHMLERGQPDPTLTVAHGARIVALMTDARIIDETSA